VKRFPPPSSKNTEMTEIQKAVGTALLVLFSNFIYSLVAGALLTILRTQGVIDFSLSFGYVFAVVCLVQSVRIWDKALFSKK
jgi:hypothetical protein